MLNESFYKEAWEAAKERLSEEIGDDQEAMERYNAFLEDSLNRAMTEMFSGEKKIAIDEALFQEYRDAETDKQRDAGR